MSLDTYPVAQVEAMQSRLAALEQDNEHLTQIIAAHRALADAHRELLARADTERSKALTVVRQVSGALDRLAALEAEAKQAREDEAWAHLHAVPIHRRQEVWLAEHFDGYRRLDAEAPTIHAALRALREKVEGGNR